MKPKSHSYASPFKRYSPYKTDGQTDTKVYRPPIRWLGPNKPKMVQRRSARFVMGDHQRQSSVTSMLSNLKWDTLEQRRAQEKTTLMYKITHDLVHIQTPMLVLQNFHLPFARTLCYQKSFFPDIIRMWNRLPPSAISCPSLETFKGQIAKLQLRWSVSSLF